jgi:hypothetical protein
MEEDVPPLGAHEYVPPVMVGVAVILPVVPEQIVVEVTFTTGFNCPEAAST